MTGYTEINIGASPNAVGADGIRAGGQKINTQFSELYQIVASLGASIADNAVGPVTSAVYFSADFATARDGTRHTFGTVRANDGGAVNITTGIFTAPRDGDYLFTGAMTITAPTSSGGDRAFFSTGTAPHGGVTIGGTQGVTSVTPGLQPSTPPTSGTLTISAMIRLSAGQSLGVGSTIPAGKLAAGPESNITIREFPKTFRN